MLDELDNKVTDNITDNEEKLFIKTLEDKDIEYVYEIHKSSIEHPWSFETFKDDCMNERNVYLILNFRYDENISNIDKDILYIGYIALNIVLDEATILGIAIDKRFRGNGYAYELCNYAFDFLKGKDVSKVFLEVRANNERAINLYKKLEFQSISVRKNYYKEPTCDGIVMCKTI